MKIKKIHLDDIYRCYCVSNLYFENKNHYIFASEDPNVGCYLYEEKNLQNKQILWQAPGGCMSILPIPDKPKEFLAIQEFYLKVSPSQSKLVWGKINDNGIVELADILNLPYLHRFGIIHQNNQNYLICSTIADDKENKDDWSKPGKIYVGKLGKYPTDKIKLEILEDGLFKNHGFYHNHGNNSVYCACDSGILKITLDLKTQCWQKKKSYIPVSVILLLST